MTLILIGAAVLLVVLVLIAVKLGFSKEETETRIDPDMERMIHVSGIYSVVRNSPREDLAALRPCEDDLRKYLDGVSEDANGKRLSADNRAALIDYWKSQTEANLRTIEDGDRRGVSFYFYDFPKICPVCAPYIARGNFVTREEIHRYPQIIPPFHLGCNCVLTAHSGSEKLKETTVAGMRPFFEDESPPPLPELNCTIIPERPQSAAVGERH